MKYYVSDSRTLETASFNTKKEAVEWLDEKCGNHGLKKGDWSSIVRWSGCETPPQLFTKQEWEAI